MFAIVKIKGFQYLAKPHDKLIVPKLDGEPNSEVSFDEVLFLKKDNQTYIGNPFIKGAKVLAKIVAHKRAPKVHVFKFIRRENYRRLKGHKQPLTEIEIISIDYQNQN
ncbi:MAG: 50S ribosomal protein L21 [candidate division WOR-3 bacterium]|nr:50S ribosomal protein L21 [candidate division WOR-3 bacterium]MCX7756850.1 50S ribosomal protein L21 [candidate division WOR-3 bacterium]MDW7987622.1 50S ribosomal protein L21 [candidate division WOR-3 bacterium]